MANKYLDNVKKIVKKSQQSKANQRITATKGVVSGAATGGARSAAKQKIVRQKTGGSGPVYENPGFKPSTRNRKKF